MIAVRLVVEVKNSAWDLIVFAICFDTQVLE